MSKTAVNQRKTVSNTQGEIAGVLTLQTTL